MRWLVLQQNDKGELYGRPILVGGKDTHTLEEALALAYKSESAPLDHRLARAIVVPIAVGHPPVAVPVQAYRPQWRLDQVAPVGAPESEQV